MKKNSRDSRFKKQSKRNQRYNLNQRKNTLKFKEDFLQIKNYGRQKR